MITHNAHQFAHVSHITFTVMPRFCLPLQGGRTQCTQARTRITQSFDSCPRHWGDHTHGTQARTRTTHCMRHSGGSFPVSAVWSTQCTLNIHDCAWMAALASQIPLKMVPYVIYILSITLLGPVTLIRYDNYNSGACYSHWLQSYPWRLNVLCSVHDLRASSWTCLHYILPSCWFHNSAIQLPTYIANMFTHKQHHNVNTTDACGGQKGSPKTVTPTLCYLSQLGTQEFPNKRTGNPPETSQKGNRTGKQGPRSQPAISADE
jgi:hypothetical protein